MYLIGYICSHSADIRLKIIPFCRWYSSSDNAPAVANWCNSHNKSIYWQRRIMSLSGDRSFLVHLHPQLRCEAEVTVTVSNDNGLGGCCSAVLLASDWSEAFRVCVSDWECDAGAAVTLGSLPYSRVLIIGEYSGEGCHCCNSGGVSQTVSSSLRVLGTSSNVWTPVNSSSSMLIFLRALYYHRHGFIPNQFYIVSFIHSSGPDCDSVSKSLVVGW